MAQSNDKIYELMNSMRLELKRDIAAQGQSLGSQISKLDTKLDGIVSDRIMPIEKDVNKLKIDSATGNVKLGVIIFIGSSIVSTLVTVVVTKAVS